MKTFRDWMIALIFTAVGITCIIGGIYRETSIKEFKKRAQTTIGEVYEVIKVRHKRSNPEESHWISYTIWIKYTVDGKEYKESISHNSSVNEGERLQVYYNEDNPEEIRISTKSNIVILVIIGVLFGGIGIILLLFQIKVLFMKIKLIYIKNFLKRNGEKTYIDFKKVISEHWLKGPFYIICEKVDDITGEIKTYKSEEIWKNPKEIITQKGIKYFPVLINKDNPEEYYMIIDEIK